MSSIYDNAKNEVKRLKFSEDCRYDKECFNSALRALKSLTRDGYSAMSIQYTMNILTRMVDRLPLSEITEQDEWETPHKYSESDNFSISSCKRYTAVYKRIYDDGRVVYLDVNRACAFDVDFPDAPSWTGTATTLFDQLYPITLPYYPATNKYRMAVKEYDEKEDLVRILKEYNMEYSDEKLIIYFDHFIDQANNKLDIKKYFIYDASVNNWVELKNS